MSICKHVGSMCFLSQCIICNALNMQDMFIDSFVLFSYFETSVIIR